MTELTPKQAMKVIKEAKKLGVTKMKLGTLEFELEPALTRPASKASQRKIAEKQFVQEQFDEFKDSLETLHVEDPVAFEQAMIDQQVVDDNSRGENLEETQHI